MLEIHIGEREELPLLYEDLCDTLNPLIPYFMIFPIKDSSPLLPTPRSRVHGSREPL